MNEDIIVLLCPNCTTQRSKETKGLSLKVLKSKRLKVQMIRCHIKEQSSLDNLLLLGITHAYRLSLV